MGDALHAIGETGRAEGRRREPVVLNAVSEWEERGEGKFFRSLAPSQCNLSPSPLFGRRLKKGSLRASFDRTE